MIKNSVPEKTADPLLTLRAEVQAASQGVEDARRRLGDAILDFPNEANRGPLRAAQDRLRAAQDALSAAVEAQTDRNTRSAAKAAAKALADRWAAAEAHAKSRQRAAKSLEAAAKSLFAAWRQIEIDTVGIAETRLAYDPAGAVLAQADLERLLRLGMAKIARDCGTNSFQGLVKGADNYLLDNLAPLSDRIEAANDHFRGQKVVP